jgi:hypothetical protein
MVLTVSFALSPVTGLFCHCHLADTSAKLDASVGASGPHDFAVREACAFVKRAARVHRIPPHVRDDRETPLMWDGTGAGIEMIWAAMEAEYLCGGGLDST